MTDVKLLPCPFCGDSEHLLVEHLQGTIIHPAYRVRCDNCGACIEYTDKDCHAAWNTRANLAELQREVEGLRAEVAVAKDGWHMANGTTDLAMKHRDAAEARAERMAEAGRRVTAAFRALGEATAWTRAAEQARHECEAAMLALDAALDQESNDA